MTEYEHLKKLSGEELADEVYMNPVDVRLMPKEILLDDLSVEQILIIIYGEYGQKLYRDAVPPKRKKGRPPRPDWQQDIQTCHVNKVYTYVGMICDGVKEGVSTTDSLTIFKRCCERRIKDTDDEQEKRIWRTCIGQIRGVMSHIIDEEMEYAKAIQRTKEIQLSYVFYKYKYAQYEPELSLKQRKEYHEKEIILRKVHYDLYRHILAQAISIDKGVFATHDKQIVTVQFDENEERIIIKDPEGIDLEILDEWEDTEEVVKDESRKETKKRIYKEWEYW